MHRAARWSLRGYSVTHSDSQTRNTGSRERNADSEAAHARTTVRRAAMQFAMRVRSAAATRRALDHVPRWVMIALEGGRLASLMSGPRGGSGSR